MTINHHPFTSQTASVSAVWYYTTGTITFLCLLYGLLTNSSVIFSFLRDKKLRRPRNYLLISLAISDLGLLLTNNTMHTIASFYNYWPFGQTGCNLYALCGGIFGLTSIATMVAIALTRLAAVLNPFSSLSLNGHFVLKCVMFSWLYGSVWIVPPFFGWNRFILDGFETTCTFDYVSTDAWDRLYVFMIVTGGFLIPLTIILVSYKIILMKLSQRNVCFTCKTNEFKNSPTHHANPFYQVTENFRRTKIRACRTALIVLTNCCMAWGPYAFVAILSQFGFNHFANPYSTALLDLFTKTSACLNPLIYTFSSLKHDHQIRLFPRLYRTEKKRFSLISS